MGKVGGGDGAQKSRSDRPAHVVSFVKDVGLRGLAMTLPVSRSGEGTPVDMPMQTSVSGLIDRG